MLEVKTGKLQFVLIGLLGLFFVPMGAGLFISGVLKGFSVVPTAIGAACLVMYALIVWLVLRAYRKSVRAFTDAGLTRNDGRQFAWTELARVVKQMARRNSGGGLFLWRCEIQFKNGESAWIIPSKVGNFEEVISYVNSLPCEQVQK
jgi:hypothetical protein